MLIKDLLVEAKSELLKFIGDTTAGMALGKIIHTHARVNSDQTPTPVKASSTIKFLQGPKWYQQMFKNNRVYILQGSSGWAAIYRRKDIGYVTRAQVELAISNDQGTRVDSDIINTVKKNGEGSLTGMLEKEIGTVQKSFWIDNHPYSRMSSDNLKISKRTDQSPYTATPGVTRKFRPLANIENPLYERIKILIPSMVTDLKRQIRKEVRQGGLEPKVELREIFDALDYFAEDKSYLSFDIVKQLGGHSIYGLWEITAKNAMKKFKLDQYSKNLTVQQVSQVFNLAKSKFIDNIIKGLFVKP